LELTSTTDSYLCSITATGQGETLASSGNEHRMSIPFSPLSYQMEGTDTILEESYNVTYLD